MEDEAIVRLYWERDERAIDATAEKYGPYCHTIAANILSAREDAEECVNDTYLRAWNAIPPERPRVLPAFLGRITRRLAINRLERLAAQKRGGGEGTLVLEELAECVSGRETVEGVYDAKELTHAIASFVSALPPGQRRLFVLRYWHAEPVAAASKRCGMTENQASVTLHRLRGRLRAYLTERGFEP